MSKRATVKLPQEEKDKIDLLSKQTNLNQGALIGYMADMFIKYNMLDGDWVEKLLESRFSELVKTHDFQMRKEVELIKLKSVTRIREKFIDQRLKSMDKEDRMRFIDQVLGDPERAGDVIDRITSQQVFVVNGQNRMCEPQQDGLPRLVGIPPSQIVRCPRGFHTALDDCRACPDRLTCEVRKQLIIDWIAVNGTTREQEEFISTGNFDVSRRLN
jgi:hypothetical protein